MTPPIRVYSNCSDPYFKLNFIGGYYWECGFAEAQNDSTITFQFPDKRPFRLLGAYGRGEVEGIGDIRINALDENGNFVYFGPNDNKVCGGNNASGSATFDWASRNIIASKVYMHGVAGRKIGLYEFRVFTDAVEAETECGEGCFTYACPDGALSKNPVSLRYGEKRLSIDDLSLNTSGNQLKLSRTYNQNLMNDFEITGMGLGWKHNHNVFMVIMGSAPDRVIRVYLVHGGVIIFDEIDPNGVFRARTGSFSTLTFESTPNEYVLRNTDHTTYRFDASTLKLSSLQSATGEVWTYTYTSGKLTSVDDGYSRSLNWSYINNPGNFNHGQVWRVGDQTASGLSGSSPSGRYVEYSYTPEKQNGSSISSPRPLLNQVQDVRGFTWDYDYYGQDSGENDSRLFNFMLARHNPDSTTAEALTYQVSTPTERAVNGDMALDSDWTDIAGAAPTTNQRSAGQVHSGTYSRSIVTSAAGQGIEGAKFDLIGGRYYTITAYVYVVTGAARMQLTYVNNPDVVTTGTGSWQQLRAIYTPRMTTHLVQLQFVAEGGAAEFYVDDVSIEEVRLTSITQHRGIVGSAQPLEEALFEFGYGGNDATLETIASRSTLHEFTLGIYTGTENALGETATNGINGYLRPASQTDANGNATALTWSGDGKRLLDVTDALNETTVFTYNTDETLKDSTDAEGRKTEYTYADTNQPRLPTRIRVFATDGTTVLRWQAFTYDTMGRVLTERQIDPADGTTVQQETTRSYYTSGDGNGLLQTLIRKDLLDPSNDSSTTYTYDSAGRVLKTQQSSMFGSCQVSYTVYDAAGNVVASICNYENTGAAPTTAAAAVALYNSSNPDKNQVTTHDYDSLGRRFKTTTNAGATFAQTSYTVYDALDRVIRAITNWDGTTNPTTTAHSAFPHGTDNTLNLVTETTYNARGLVRNQTDVLGHVTLMGYDDGDRLIKTIVNASQPTYNNDYIGTTPDPDLNGYIPSGNADEDIITTSGYDAAGNLVRTTDPLDISSYTVYDALNRPVKTVRSAKSTATILLNPGDTGYDATEDPRSSSYAPSTNPDRDLIDTTEYDAMGRVIRTQRLMENRLTTVEWETTLYGYDALGRQVKVIRIASQPTYNIAADPDLSAYTPSTDPDQDIATLTAYDDHGRVLYTEDASGQRTWQAYDGLNRVVKTIANAVGTATDGGTNDPRSSSYVPSSDPDEDLITLTVYDSDGRVQTTEDPLGRKTYNVYDSLGRTIRTVTNWVDVGESPALWVWNNGWKKSNGTTAIPLGYTLDENQVNRTVYDAQGRVWKTIDPINNQTWYEYDALGRRTKTIRNYVDGVYSSTNPDLDVIETVTYDIVGRVVTTATTNNSGSPVTRMVYDALGRTVKTIANYVAQGTTDPADWLWDATDSRWERGDGNAVSFGTDNDQNRISETTYNQAGQVIATRDARGTLTTFTYDTAGRRLTTTAADGTSIEVVDRMCYDKAGRTLRRIQAWSGTGDPDARATNGTWTFDPSSHGTDNDVDLISVFTYDRASRQTSVANPEGDTNQTAYRKDGQVMSVTDPLSVVTVYRYDKARRRVKVVQSYQVQGTTDPADWLWDATDSRWERGNGTAVSFGTDSDQNIIVELTYDKGGRTLSQRDPRGNLTTYTYDGLNRRITLTNPLSQTWTTDYAYIYTGSPATPTRIAELVVDPDANITLRVRDRLGRLLGISYLYESGTPKPTPDTFFTYDALGNRLTMTERSDATVLRKTTYTYDAANRIQSIAFDNNGDGTDDETVSYSYDVGGLRTQLTLPGSLNIDSAYDERRQLTSIDDWDNAATTVTYTQVGRRKTVTRPNDVITTAAYDLAGRLTELSHVLDGMTPTTLAEFVYTVNGRGDRTTATETVLTSGGTDTWDITYSYDAIARVRDAHIQQGSTNVRRDQYAFDVAGNRTAQTVTIGAGSPTTTNTTYNAANQISNSGYTYDARGNLTSDGTNSYTWDRANRLLSKGLVSYKYDGLGNRITSTVSSTTTRYLLDLQAGLTQVLSATTGANINRYVHTLGGLLAQEDAAGNWEWLLGDGLGSVRSVTDNSGTVLEHRHYDPYGNLYAGAMAETDFGFTGEQFDSTAGLLYLRARHYAPSIGTFVSRDPFEGLRNHPMSLNGYNWVGGNIANATDPSGKYWFLQARAGSSQAMPAADFSNVSPDLYLPKLIQSEALSSTIAHAEYPVTRGGNYIDLLHVNDTSRKVEYWEIKSNTNRGKSEARQTLASHQQAIAREIGRNRLSSTYISPVENPSFRYDWNTYQWELGLNYPLVLLGQVTGDDRYWLARQALDEITNEQIPGIIVYWAERHESDPEDVPLFLGVMRRNLPSPEATNRNPRIPPDRPGGLQPAPQPSISLETGIVGLGIGLAGVVALMVGGGLPDKQLAFPKC